MEIRPEGLQAICIIRFVLYPLADSSKGRTMLCPFDAKHREPGIVADTPSAYASPASAEDK